jgi:hypothetical protein
MIRSIDLPKAPLWSALLAAAALLAPAPATHAAAEPAPGDILLVYDAARASIRFAAGDVETALRAKGFRVSTAGPAALRSPTASHHVVITTADTAWPRQPVVSGLTAQGYAIRRTGDNRAQQWWAIGHDAPGAMYAGLELAEAVILAGGLREIVDRTVNPHVLRRGIKFNIPLDARSPSYSDDSTSAQANIAEMWSMEFWTSMLDEMARHRYNFLSLWNLSPFPSLVRVPEYPAVALADVKRKVGSLWDATLQGRRMYDPAWELETLRVMTIDAKIAFWRAVMEHARDRGVDVALFTWNTFVYGTEGSGYGITDSLDNPVTKDYVRKSVRTLFDTYPLLTAIGITSGENMGDESSGTDVKERWLWETYGLGVRDAMDDARDPGSPHHRPDRTIQLIHRAHQSDLAAIVPLFRQLPGYDDAESAVAFSFKYSQAHMHSSTKPLFIFQNGWFDSIPPGKKTWLTVRNDDMYYMRWGDPDFARAYLTSLPDLGKIAGFYMGPDGYTWGREFVGRTSAAPRELVIEKMWYSFLLWGRLAYEPSLPNRHFQRILSARFPEASGEDLFEAWAAVSRILPLMTRFYWGDLDFRWYPEACWSLAGFVTVQDLIAPKYQPMKADEDGQVPRIMSVKAFVDGESPAGRLTPLDVAGLLERHASEGLTHIDRVAGGTDRTLRETRGDITAMAWLGRYYAAKIRGAVDLYRFQTTGGTGHHARARVHLQEAASHWKRYAALWSSQYVGQVLTRMGLTPIDISAFQAFVDREVPAPLAP